MREKKTAEEAKRREMMMEMVRELGITDANELYSAGLPPFAGPVRELEKAEYRRSLSVQPSVMSNN